MPGILVVDLARSRRLWDAVPALVDTFHIDADFLPECGQEALAVIGDPEASRRIVAPCPGPSPTSSMLRRSSWAGDRLGRRDPFRGRQGRPFLLTEQDLPGQAGDEDVGIVPGAGPEELDRLPRSTDERPQEPSHLNPNESIDDHP